MKLKDYCLSLLNWMISYCIVIIIIATYMTINPRIDVKFLDSANVPFWVELVQVLLLVIFMIPIYLKLNKWMKVKIR